MKHVHAPQGESRSLAEQAMLSAGSGNRPMSRACAVLLCAVLGLAAAVEAQTPASIAPNATRLIVKFRADTQKAALSKRARVSHLAAAVGVSLAHARPMALDMDVVELDAPRTLSGARAIAARMAAQPGVEFAEVDMPVGALRIPNDQFTYAQTYLADWPTFIGAYSAWDVTTGSGNVVVAVIDSGIRPHEDFTGRLVPGWDFVSETIRSNDGDGRDADPSDPGDFVTQADIDAGLTGVDCRPQNSSWHGTKVAGVLGANGDNARWTTGIDWAAKIEPVRALGKCGGVSSDVIDAIAWAAGLPVPGTPPNAFPAHVINLSLGHEGSCSPPYQVVIAAALATGRVRAIVAAAGNDNAQAVLSPANCLGVLSVVATNSSGARARYSNYGGQAWIAAPGGQDADGIYTLSNTGAHGPGVDTFAIGNGTSFAAAMVSATAALMLAVAPDIDADSLAVMLLSAAKPFPAASDCSTAICGAGILDVGNAVRAAHALAPAANYEGLWWNSAENGWGINLAHQGERIYLTWYTYDGAGKASWLAMLATKTAPATYGGDIIELHGPSLNANPFAPAPTATTVGNGTLTFTDSSNGTFSYTAKNIPGTKAITRYPFVAPPPVCVYGAAPDLAAAINYQDLWWDSAENGWGINLAHQGTQIYATWYTYDTDGSPLWLASLMDQTAPGSYRGALFRTTGPAFGAPWNASQVVVNIVGTAVLDFANGNSAAWTHTGPVAGIKPITRYLFSAPSGTVCR